jgi:hypothetical protein
VAECFGLETTPPPENGAARGVWGGPHPFACRMDHLPPGPNLKLTPPEYRKLLCDELLNWLVKRVIR